MTSVRKHHRTFPLRLPLSLRTTANELAQKDGTSLNHFISVAVAEKVSRLEQAANNYRQPVAPPPLPQGAAIQNLLTKSLS